MPIRRKHTRKLGFVAFLVGAVALVVVLANALGILN